MKKVRSVLAALALAGAAPVLAQPVVIKMATIAPDGSAYATILKEMGEKWKTISKDQVQLKLYLGSVAGDDTDVVRKMRLGTLNAGLLASPGVGHIDRTLFALQVPMMYSSYDEVDHVLSKMESKIEAAIEAKGFVVLNWVDAGWVRFFTKTPVTTPDQLKALKLFTWAGDGEATEIWKSAGFNPIPLPSTEISTALQTGLVQALPTTPQGAVILQWYNHAKNMTNVKWALLLGATVVTKSSWEKVPAALRPQLLAAAREAGAKFRAETRAGETRDIEAMKKRGVNIIEIDAKTEAAWRAVAEQAYPRIRGKAVPPEAWDEAKKILADYRASKK